LGEKKFATEAEILARLRELTQEVRKVRDEFRDAIGRAASAPAQKSRPRETHRTRKKR
jgi:hypothetical protein